MKPDPAALSGTDPDGILVHYHEIGLKGANRGSFERRLIDNLQRSLSGLDAKVENLPGRVLVRLPPTADLALASEKVRKVFGISHFAATYELNDPSLDSLSDLAVSLATTQSPDSFEVRARKGHTSFPEGGQRINEVVGQAIKDATGSRVDLSDPAWSLQIELVTGKAYLHFDRRQGPGGLPVGISGKALSLLSGGIDSPVATWEVAKRGMSVDLVHFHGQPFSDPSSVRQATSLARHLEPWLMGTTLWLVPFGDIQKQIVSDTPEDLRIVIYRRFMMRIAEALGKQVGAQALITGESLGQVASQTIENITAIGEVVDTLPVLRPLVGRDKIEIERMGRSIGTYEISISPHQDCCVLFVPRKVATKASRQRVHEAETGLDIASLVEKGVANSEKIHISA